MVGANDLHGIWITQNPSLYYALDTLCWRCIQLNNMYKALKRQQLLTQNIFLVENHCLRFILLQPLCLSTSTNLTVIFHRMQYSLKTPSPSDNSNWLHPRSPGVGPRRNDTRTTTNRRETIRHPPVIPVVFTSRLKSGSECKYLRIWQKRIPGEKNPLPLGSVGSHTRFRSSQSVDRSDDPSREREH